jgi:hypothetical protein
MSSSELTNDLSAPRIHFVTRDAPEEREPVRLLPLDTLLDVVEPVIDVTHGAIEIADDRTGFSRRYVSILRRVGDELYLTFVVGRLGVLREEEIDCRPSRDPILNSLVASAHYDSVVADLARDNERFDINGIASRLSGNDVTISLTSVEVHPIDNDVFPLRESFREQTKVILTLLVLVDIGRRDSFGESRLAGARRSDENV